MGQVLAQYIIEPIITFFITITPYAVYYLLICVMLTIIMSLSGILGGFAFIIILYFYIKGILLYNPPSK